MCRRDMIKTGKLSTVLVANRDVTEEKEREIERDKNLRNALAAAEHANRAKTAFLNNMSIYIRTPMTSDCRIYCTCDDAYWQYGACFGLSEKNSYIQSAFA